MARLSKQPYPGNWNFDPRPIDAPLSYNPFLRTKDMMDELIKRSDAVADRIDVQDGGNGDLTGFLMRFPVADGYAFYAVSKDQPGCLEVQHVPFLDAYSVSAAHIRGMRRDDVLQQVEWSRFGRKH